MSGSSKSVLWPVCLFSIVGILNIFEKDFAAYFASEILSGISAR